MSFFGKSLVLIAAGAIAACVPTQQTSASGVAQPKTPVAPSLLERAEFDICPAFASRAGIDRFSADNWTDHLGLTVAQPNKLKDWPVDFSQDTVLRYTVGSKPSAGYSIQIVEPLQVDDDQVLTIAVKHNEPKSGDVVATVLTSPCAYLLVRGAGSGAVRVVDADSGKVMQQFP